MKRHMLDETVSLEWVVGHPEITHRSCANFWIARHPLSIEGRHQASLHFPQADHPGTDLAQARFLNISCMMVLDSVRGVDLVLRQGSDGLGRRGLQRRPGPMPCASDLLGM